MYTDHFNGTPYNLYLFTLHILDSRPGSCVPHFSFFLRKMACEFSARQWKSAWSLFGKEITQDWMQRSTIVAGAAAAHDQSVFCVYIYNAHTTYTSYI